MQASSDAEAPSGARMPALVVLTGPGATVQAVEGRRLSGQNPIIQNNGRSRMIVPLRAHGRLSAVMTITARRGEHYTGDDLALAQSVARRVELSLENAQLYQQAKEALRARDEFLGIAAHEIRGPITAMHLASQTLERAASDPVAVRKATAIITREDRRLARLVDELLDVSRLRGGQLHFHLEHIDLAEIARRVASQMSPEIVRSGSDLSLATVSGATGSWDRFRLEQVATNLLGNAIKFGKGRPIEMRVEKEGSTARLVVRDHGIGIPVARQSQLFRPFERAVSSRHYGGLGLGLFIVRTIVEGLGGTVSLSSADGAGTRVTVELPMTAGATA